LTPEYGERLDPLLRERKDRLFGILNGIDYETLNPATDPYIAVNYDADSLDKRVQNKLALQGEAGLPRDPSIPLIGMVSRLTDQKGLDILVEILDHLFDNFGVQFVLLGTGEQHYHDVLMGLAKRYPQNMGLFLTFNAPLAQRIYAGTDMFLMPSRFEPCGLSQMIAMRYGSVPIVRATGGLADTVKDYNPVTGEGTGFVFDRYDRWALFGAIVRALERYKNPQEWRRIQLQGMRADFSWEASARKYEDIYYKALASKKEDKGNAGEEHSQD
jgi:starch synthase